MVTVRLFAAAAEAAGVDETQVAATTVGEVRAQLIDAHGAGFAPVLRQCAIVVGGHRRADDAEIPSAVTVDVLPPFAGG
ncbi:MoaD/ThiS family protein [Demequina muriae]|uniref:MoaD/ThiS family protein n=1 Tax=Demequina muriae TaxID=3051664 RepID=A0ABT8GIZ7_9MICO|nr:MoaD/ThiS family protein [Demequina sp. EGI L300058]MDN4481406.1 MoaD/ThiS family protein [Demequina sp. EGI L300058]